MWLPTLTPEQRADGVARATQARQVRAGICADLKASRLTIAEALARANTDGDIAKLRVAELLASMPGIGKANAAAIMQRLDIATSRRIRGLGHHQLAALEREFGR